MANSSKNQLLLRTTALADQLDVYRESLVQNKFDADDPVLTCIKLQLAPKLAALIPWIIDDLNKVHEINYATAHPGVQVNPQNKGADLLDTDGGAVEHKYSKLRAVVQRSKVDGSVTKKLGTYKCNVNFDLPVVSAGAVDPGERLSKLRDSLDKKIKRYVVVEIAGPLPNDDTRKYYLGHMFMLEYLQQYLAKKPKAVRANLGGVMCKTCGEVHRLRDMAAASERVTEEDKAKVVQAFLLDKIVSQCKDEE